MTEVGRKFSCSVSTFLLLKLPWKTAEQETQLVITFCTNTYGSKIYSHWMSQQMSQIFHEHFFCFFFIFSYWYLASLSVASVCCGRNVLNIPHKKKKKTIFNGQTRTDW